MNTSKTCSFIGHRNAILSDLQITYLYNLIENLVVCQHVDIFIIGSRSKFNDICHKIVTDIKMKHHHIQRLAYTCKHEVCVLANKKSLLEKTYTRLSNKKINLLEMENEVEFKNKYLCGKASYIKRNFAIIDDSDFCIFYYNKNYTPKTTNSGTAIAYNYAIWKNNKYNNKIIYNIFET